MLFSLMIVSHTVQWTTTETKFAKQLGASCEWPHAAMSRQPKTPTDDKSSILPALVIGLKHDDRKS